MGHLPFLALCKKEGELLADSPVSGSQGACPDGPGRMKMLYPIRYMDNFYL